MSFKPMQISEGVDAKLKASPSFLEHVRKAEGDFLAFIEVTTPGYVPPGVKLRGPVGANGLSAEVPVRALDQLLSDARVLRVTPADNLFSQA